MKFTMLEVTLEEGFVVIEFPALRHSSDEGG